MQIDKMEIFRQISKPYKVVFRMAVLPDNVSPNTGLAETINADLNGHDLEREIVSLESHEHIQDHE